MFLSQEEDSKTGEEDDNTSVKNDTTPSTLNPDRIYYAFGTLGLTTIGGKRKRPEFGRKETVSTKTSTTLHGPRSD